METKRDTKWLTQTPTLSQSLALHQTSPGSRWTQQPFFTAMFFIWRKTTRQVFQDRLDRCLQAHTPKICCSYYTSGWGVFYDIIRISDVCCMSPMLAQMLVVVYQLSRCTHSVTHCCKLLTLLPNVTNKVLPDPTCNTLKVYLPTHMLNKKKWFEKWCNIWLVTIQVFSNA